MVISPFMEEAIRISENGRLNAPPNPWVGAIVVNNGQIVGSGFHERPGTPHAEVNALKQAGSAAQGAIIYTTLEPCSHTGRTPPCAQTIIDSGIRKVVVAVEDPDPQVSGAGITMLEKAGVIVEVGHGKNVVEQSLRPYLHHRKTGLPWCVIKTATSIDGRIAAADGTSKWITGEEARRDAHKLRAESQGIAVGSNTAIADNPSLTVRLGSRQPNKPPLRVVFDTRGRVPLDSALFDTTVAPTLVFTSCETEGREGENLEMITLPMDKAGEHVDLREALAVLGKRGVVQLMIEGGAVLQASFFRQGLAHELVVYMGGRILGRNGIPCMAFDVETFEAALLLKLESVSRVGDDVKLRYLF